MATLQDPSLLVLFNGTNGQTDYTAETGQNCSFIGNAQLDTVNILTGPSSLKLDGIEDGVLLPASEEYYFGSGDFTIDCQVYITNTNGVRDILRYSGGVDNFNTIDGTIWVINCSGGFVYFYWNTDGNYDYIRASMSTMTSNAWNRITVTRKVNYLRLFINGVRQAMVTMNGSISRITNGGERLGVGYSGYSNLMYSLQGNIDSIRIIKGECVWDKDFDTYFVDIGMDSNPNFLPNDANYPIGWLDFRKITARYFLFKGVRHDDTLTLKLWNIDIKKWGNDPYRLKIYKFEQSGFFSIEGGIIECTNEFFVYQYQKTIKNMYIKCNYFRMEQYLDGVGSNIFGSTIIANNAAFAAKGYGGTANSTHDIRDSIFAFSNIDFTLSYWQRNNTPYITANFNVINCVFTLPYFTHINLLWQTNTNNQFGWLPPVWPSWNANKYAFASKILTTGINAPPQPGSMNFSEYPKGLFGNPRTGIGALYFPVPTSELNVGQNINITVTNSAESILSKESLQSFNSVISKPVFNNSSNWESVIVVYEHSSGQNRYVNHKFEDGVWKGDIVFPSECQPGVWQKKKIIITDKVGAVITIGRDEIGLFEDLNISF